MPAINLAFLGNGTVVRALEKLLVSHRNALADVYGVEFTFTGVATRSSGWLANATGLNLAAPAGSSCSGIREWLAASRPHVVFEAIALDPIAGQPALDYLREILEHRAHAVSANKGPVVFGYASLQEIAMRAGRLYRFESAVMDGAPVFSLMRECLPLVGLHAVRGVFTSTATVVLEAIEEGLSLNDGIARAQALGIAEADPSYDVDGWDSAVKLCALANVLMGGNLRPHQVVREGIRTVSEPGIRSANAKGHPWRLIGEVRRDDAGALHAWVGPRQIPQGDALAVGGTTLVTHFEADMFPGGLTVTSRDPDPTTTAYGMFADFINTCRPPVGGADLRLFPPHPEANT